MRRKSFIDNPPFIKKPPLTARIFASAPEASQDGQTRGIQSHICAALIYFTGTILPISDAPA